MACEKAQANVSDDVAKQVATFVDSAMSRASSESTQTDTSQGQSNSAVSEETMRTSNQLAKATISNVALKKQYWELRDYSETGGPKSIHVCWVLVEIARKVNHPAMVLIFDAANILCQGFTAEGVYEQYKAMKPYIGWMHIKDYRHPKPPQRVGHIDEDAIKNFVPSDIGHSGHEAMLRDFREQIPKLDAKLKKRGIPGVFLDLEPHVKGGGQFGGFSGPDGMGVALRSLCRVLDYVKIDYHLRDFDDIRAARGF